MAADKNKQGQSDKRRVTAHEDYDIDFLAEKLGVSREEVEIAIEAVGNNHTKIEAFLQQHSSHHS